MAGIRKAEAQRIVLDAIEDHFPEAQRIVLDAIEDHFPEDVAARFKLDDLGRVVEYYRDVEKGDDADAMADSIARVAANTVDREWDALCYGFALDSTTSWNYDVAPVEWLLGQVKKW